MTTLNQLVAELDAIRDDAAKFVSDTRNDPDLTPEGRVNRLANWNSERQWTKRTEEIQRRGNAILDDFDKAAADRRSKILAGSGDTAAATLAELRLARRGDRIRAQLDSGDYADNITELVQHATADEVGPLVEMIVDHYAGMHPSDSKPGTAAKAVDSALRARDPQFKQAAELADQTEGARGVFEARAEALEMVATDSVDEPWKLNWRTSRNFDEHAGPTIGSTPTGAPSWTPSR